MSKIYTDIFTDSTEHTVYSVTITSENGETITLEADDPDVREILELLT